MGGGADRKLVAHLPEARNQSAVYMGNKRKREREASSVF